MSRHEVVRVWSGCRATRRHPISKIENQRGLRPIISPGRRTIPWKLVAERLAANNPRRSRTAEFVQQRRARATNLPTRPRVVGAVAFETPREGHHAPDAKSNIPMTVRCRPVLWREPTNGVSLGGAKGAAVNRPGNRNRFRVSLPCLRRWRFEKRGPRFHEIEVLVRCLANELGG
jgi:hypothetical protein